jgi:two-component system sensor histidine kinase ChvG
MAVDTERQGRRQSLWFVRPSARPRPPVEGDDAAEETGARGLLRRAGRAFVEFLYNGPLIRWIAGSLLRRIIVSNLLGLTLLLIGIVYVSHQNVWLIDARRDSLLVQADVIAKAIAMNASVDPGGGLRIDPDKLPTVEGSLIPFRDDSFAALELSLSPERVAPVLRRFVDLGTNRARVYGRDGTLIADTALLLQRGQITARPEDTRTGRPRNKNFWTRLTEWLIDDELPVYREIGTANGMAYSVVRSAMTGVSIPLLELTEDGERIVSVAVPIQRSKSVQGVLLLATLPGNLDQDVAAERQTIFLLAIVAFAAAVFASVLLARTVAGPIRRLSDTAEHVSHNITARQELPDYSGRTDEVGQLARAFRSMTGALYRRIEASEKFAADVAHELKNPLTAARSTAESLAYARNDAERDQLVAQIQYELKRLNRLITDVSNASRLDAELARQQLEAVDLVDVTSGIVRTFEDILYDRTQKVVLEIAPSSGDQNYVVTGHDGRLGQVLTNLIDNAVSFSPEDGVVTVRLARDERDVIVTVEDRGPGIPPDKLEKIFERFYTDRPQTEAQRGKNSGLGLSISREIVRAHGGRISAENVYPPEGAPLGQPIGARFVVRLPGGRGSGASGRSPGARGRFG